jgi:hypothetical protein
MISVLILPSFYANGRTQAKVACTKPPAPKKQARLLDPPDEDILDYFRENDSEPVRVWQVINSVAARKPARSRSERREIKRQLLARVRPLTRAGLLRRIGRSFLALPAQTNDSPYDKYRPRKEASCANSRPPNQPGSGPSPAGSAGCLLV